MSKKMIRWAIIVGLILVAYFAQVEVNTYLGKKALAATGLEALPLPLALEAASQQSKLVLADLSAIWCPTCRKVDKLVLGDATVKAAIRERFIFARIEYESDEGTAFQSRYQVSGFPNILVLNAKGELVQKLEVTLKPENFVAQLATVP